MKYYFPSFTLDYDPHSAWVNTIYPDTTWSGGYPNKDDAYHAELLGITPGEHRLIHELTHHVVGQIYGHDSCPIVRASALHLPMPDNSDELEWQITALCYFALGKEMRHAHEWSAIGKLAERGRIQDKANVLRKLFNIRGYKSYKIKT